MPRKPQQNNTLKTLQQLKYLRSLQLITRGITHNFNNIFTGILAQTQSANNTSTRNEELLGQLVARGIEETETLFHFARLHCVKMTVQHVGNLIETTARSLRSISPMHTITFHRQQEIAKVRGCHEELVLMLFYIGENALETGVHGINLRFYVSHSTGTKSPYVQIIIEDDGPGIDPQLHDDIFSPFTTTKNEPNSGLGLPMAREIANRHGGEVELVRSSHNGCSFSLRLPMVNEEEAEKTRPITSQKKMRWTRQVFFIIEDDGTMLEFLLRGLQRKGHMVFSAGSCEEAMEEFGHVSGIVTVLLIDINLTDSDGFSCMKQLLATHAIPSVIFMSGDEEKERLKEFPDAVFLAKPFSIGRLEEIAAYVTV